MLPSLLLFERIRLCYPLCSRATSTYPPLEIPFSFNQMFTLTILTNRIGSINELINTFPPFEFALAAIQIQCSQCEITNSFICQNRRLLHTTMYCVLIHRRFNEGCLFSLYAFLPTIIVIVMGISREGERKEERIYYILFAFVGPFVLFVIELHVRRGNFSLVPLVALMNAAS